MVHTDLTYYVVGMVWGFTCHLELLHCVLHMYAPAVGRVRKPILLVPPPYSTSARSGKFQDANKRHEAAPQAPP